MNLWDWICSLFSAHPSFNNISKEEIEHYKNFRVEVPSIVKCPYMAKYRVTESDLHLIKMKEMYALIWDAEYTKMNVRVRHMPSGKFASYKTFEGYWIHSQISLLPNV